MVSSPDRSSRDGRVRLLTRLSTSVAPDPLVTQLRHHNALGRSAADIYRVRWSTGPTPWYLRERRPSAGGVPTSLIRQQTALLLGCALDPVKTQLKAVKGSLRVQEDAIFARTDLLQLPDHRVDSDWWLRGQ